MRLLLAGILMASALAAQAPEQADGRISGRVLNAATGAALRKAVVVLSGTLPRQSQVRLTAETDAEGAFEFLSLPAAAYRLSASRAGFVERAARQVFTVTAGAIISNAEIRLQPFGTISGRVLDEDGEPEPEASVQVFKQIFQNGRKQWDRINGNFAADENGQYKVARLAPGRYILRADKQRGGVDNRYFQTGPESRTIRFYMPSYYSGALTAQEATALEIASGSELRNIDIRLTQVTRPPMVRLRGRVAGVSGNAHVSISATSQDIISGSYARADPPDYNFEVSAALGRCQLVANVYESMETQVYARMDLTVSGDASGLVLTMTPPLKFAARLIHSDEDGTVKLEGVRVRLFSEDLHTVYERRSDASGKLALQFLNWPGMRLTLDVDPETLPPGWYVRKVSLGGEEVTPADFELKNSGALDILIARGAAMITGTVVDREGKPFPTAKVALIPNAPGAPSAMHAVDEAGSFQFTGFPPGDFKLFAWEEVDRDLWQDPEFRKKYETRASSVSAAGNQPQNVRPRVITADEM